MGSIVFSLFTFFSLWPCIASGHPPVSSCLTRRKSKLSTFDRYGIEPFLELKSLRAAHYTRLPFQIVTKQAVICFVLDLLLWSRLLFTFFQFKALNLDVTKIIWWPELGNPAFCHVVAKWTRQHFLALHRRSVSAFTILKHFTAQNSGWLRIGIACRQSTCAYNL